MKASLIVAAVLLATLEARAQPPSTETLPRKDAKAEAKTKASKPAPKAPAKPAAKPSGGSSKAATPSKVQASKNVTIYTNTPPPAIKDKDGRVIPATPDAYDVSSALPKKK